MDGGAFHGPSEPDYVYWRRRAVVGMAVLLTVGLIAWSCAGSDAGDERDADAVRPAVGGTSAAPSWTSAPADVGATVTVTATPKPLASRSPSVGSAGGPCRDSDLRVALRADADAYDAGDAPKFVLRVTSGRACKVKLGPKRLEVTITSGTDRIWSSAHCAGQQRNKKRKVSPHRPYRTSMRWSRTRSDPDACGDDGQPAGARPGWYVAVAELGGVRSDKVVFQLRG